MKVNTYFKESYNELVNKVTWPTSKELQSSALVVMVASFIIALLILIIDLASENLMNGLYSLFF